MIVTPKILARLAAIVLVGVLLQLSFFSQVDALPRQPRHPARAGRLARPARRQHDRRRRRLLGRLPARLPAGRSRSAAARWSCSRTGYLAGLFRERFEIHSSLVPPLLCMGLTLFAELGFGAVQLMLGVDAPVSAPGRPRHAAQERLRVLPRAGRSTWPCAAPCGRPWSRSRRAASPRGGRPCWEPESACTCAPDEPARDGSPPRPARRGPRRRRRSRSSRSSSSGSGTCRSSPATSTWRRRRTTAPASSR